ncbi:syntaxin-5 isoform 3-T4 [Mergus octosetaceus]
MNARRRHGSRNTEQGVYLGPPQTQAVPPQPPPPLPPPVADVMSCRDRTQEFLSACKSLQGRQQNGLQPSRAAAGAARQRSDFSLMAKRIGKDLSNTFAKLEKLTILAKRKSLFDDKAVEIEELTYIIKQSKLASMSNDFKSVLEVRTENLKQQRSRREHFSRAPVSALPLAASNLGGSAMLQDEPQRAADIAIEMDARTSQQLQLIDEQDSYIQSRADTMQNIESTIVELGSIFQQLAHMVKEQEETIQRIDASVEDAQLNVEAAHGEILKYFQSVTSNRWLLVKIFLILIVFFIVFVVFLA